MLTTYTAKYLKIDGGYMGQLIEWQEVITEGETIEECREMLKDATMEMILAYRQQNKEIPLEKSPTFEVLFRTNFVKVSHFPIVNVIIFLFHKLVMDWNRFFNIIHCQINRKNCYYDNSRN